MVLDLVRHRAIPWVIAAVLLAFTLSGASPARADGGTVTGTVTVNGALASSGIVTMVSGGATCGTSGQVVSGNYSLTVGPCQSGTTATLYYNGQPTTTTFTYVAGASVQYNIIVTGGGGVANTVSGTVTQNGVLLSTGTISLYVNGVPCASGAISGGSYTMSTTSCATAGSGTIYVNSSLTSTTINYTPGGAYPNTNVVIGSGGGTGTVSGTVMQNGVLLASGSITLNVNSITCAYGTVTNGYYTITPTNCTAAGQATLWVNNVATTATFYYTPGGTFANQNVTIGGTGGAGTISGTVMQNGVLLASGQVTIYVSNIPCGSATISGGYYTLTPTGCQTGTATLYVNGSPTNIPAFFYTPGTTLTENITIGGTSGGTGTITLVVGIKGALWTGTQLLQASFASTFGTPVTAVFRWNDTTQNWDYWFSTASGNTLSTVNTNDFLFLQANATGTVTIH